MRHFTDNHTVVNHRHSGKRSFCLRIKLRVHTSFATPHLGLSRLSACLRFCFTHPFTMSFSQLHPVLSFINLILKQSTEQVAFTCVVLDAHPILYPAVSISLQKLQTSSHTLHKQAWGGSSLKIEKKDLNLRKMKKS